MEPRRIHLYGSAIHAPDLKGDKPMVATTVGSPIIDVANRPLQGKGVYGPVTYPTYNKASFQSTRLA